MEPSSPSVDLYAAVLVTCEHASAAVPPGVELGLGAEILASHVAWDPGAASVAAALAELLGCEHRAGRYTRLFVDLNRSAASPAVVPDTSFGVSVAANRALAAAARAARIAAHHRPHWDMIHALVEASIARTGVCLHLAVHSFTPDIDSELMPGARRFDIGVLFDPERAGEAAVAAVLVAELARAGYDVRQNQPYLGIDDGLTTGLRPRFAPHAYAGIEIELCQALALDPQRAARLPADLAAAAAPAVRALLGAR